MLRAVAILCLITGSLGLVLADQGHSEPYREYLNQPKPEWLNIGEPIKVAENAGFDASISFPEAGDDGLELRVTRYSISLPQKDIAIKFEHSISGWTEWDNARQKWLSPNGRTLIVDTDSYTAGGLRVYEILGQGSYREIAFVYPELTFDSSDRGTLSGWRWASNDVLLAESAIENEDTGEHKSSRVYAYHWKEKILSRLDLDSLNLGDFDYGEIVGVSQDADYIRIRIDGDTYTLKSDLNSTPKLLKKAAHKFIKEPVPGTSSAIISPSLAGKHAPPVRQPFPWLWLLAIVAVMLGVFSYLYTSSRHR